MGRLILFGIVLIITFFIWIIKQAAGKVSGSERLQQTSFKGQTQKTMAWMAVHRPSDPGIG